MGVKNHKRTFDTLGMNSDSVGIAKNDDGYGIGRKCATEECPTILSRYNPNDKCSLHYHTWSNR